MKFILVLILAAISGILIVIILSKSSDNNLFWTRSPSSERIVQVYEIERYDQRIPDILIIGVRKAGTTALLRILGHHPEIEGTYDEVCYFSARYKYERGISWYIKQMPWSRKSQLTLEKCPNYFPSFKAPQRVKLTSKNVKIILLIRNPLSRTISDYFFQKRKGTANQHNTFTSKVLPHGLIDPHCTEIRFSVYDLYYGIWLNFFPKEQILLLNDDNMKLNLIEELIKVEKFLNISHYFKDDMFHYNKSTGEVFLKDSESMSQYAGVRHDNLPDIPQDAFNKVAEFLQPHASKFCQMASINYTWCTDLITDRRRNNKLLNE